MAPVKGAFLFMDIIEIPYEETEKEPIQIKTPPKKVVVKEYKVPEVKLSENIQKFDKRPKVFTENPVSYNSIALKKGKPNVLPSSSAQEMITDQTYHTIGKFLGVDTAHDWNKQYNKIYAISEWAKHKTGEKNIGKLLRWLSSQAKHVPNVGAKNIDNLYIFARLYLSKL